MQTLCVHEATEITITKETLPKTQSFCLTITVKQEKTETRIYLFSKQEMNIQGENTNATLSN